MTTLEPGDEVELRYHDDSGAEDESLRQRAIYQPSSRPRFVAVYSLDGQMLSYGPLVEAAEGDYRQPGRVPSEVRYQMFTTHPDLSSRASAGLIAIGYWRANNAGASRLPDPRDFIDPTWDVAERERVVAYLRSKPVAWTWRGFSACRICGLGNGSTCLSDGKHIWPKGFAHYVEAHQVRPPQTFVDHALAGMVGVRIKADQLAAHLGIEPSDTVTVVVKAPPSGEPLTIETSWEEKL